MKTALITGITGQDGAYLARLLLDKGYRVVGAARRSSRLDLWRLRYLGVKEEDLEIETLELLEQGNVIRLIERVNPDEIYNLAAQTFVGASFEQPTYTMDVNGLGPVRLLEAIRQVDKRIKFYQASTSEMFGKVFETPQSEKTPFYPRSPYGIGKLASHWATVNYRESYGMHACSGILFNHESPLRGPEFVTQKIAQGLARIKEGRLEHLELGNLDAKRDWGFARDYVEAMHLMLQQDRARDYVIATGVMCTVRSFAGLVADELGMQLEWVGSGLNERATWNGKTVILVSEKLYRPAEVDRLCGDASAAREDLGWQYTMTVAQLAAMMANAARA
jgi:GDPmannose 4,6-dehydratase